MIVRRLSLVVAGTGAAAWRGSPGETPASSPGLGCCPHGAS